MKLLHDIRDQMPKFAANFFPPYEYQPYPRMMVDKTDPARPKPYLDAAKKPIAVNSAEEEAEFWASKKGSVPAVEAPKVVEIPLAAVARQQFEALTPAQAEKAVEANETVAPKRRGRPPTPKNLTA